MCIHIYVYIYIYKRVLLSFYRIFKRKKDMSCRLECIFNSSKKGITSNC